MLTLFFVILFVVILAGVAYVIADGWGSGSDRYLPPSLPPPHLPPAPQPPASPPQPQPPPHWGGRKTAPGPETRFRVKEVRRHGADVKPAFAPRPAGPNGFRRVRRQINLDAICNRTGRAVRECRCDDCRVLREQHGIG